jgi:hypothetical protein
MCKFLECPVCEEFCQEDGTGLTICNDCGTMFTYDVVEYTEEESE